MRPTVGVDARTATGDRSGVGYYLTNLVEHGAFDGTDVVAYHDGSEPEPTLDTPPATGLTWRSVAPPAGVASVLGPAAPAWWVNVTLRRALRRDGVDAFLGPNFVQPVGLSLPSAVVVHDMVHRCRPETHGLAYRTYLRTFLPLSVRSADRVLTVSESTKRDLERFHRLGDTPVTVTHAGAADDYRPRRLEPSTRRRLASAYDLPERFLLYVGNIEPRKNLSTLLQALARVDADRRLPLVIAGQSHLPDAALEAELDEAWVDDWLRFTGYVPESDLPLLYNAAEVFVYPSVYEGFGLPVLEAMQSGLPVVTSNVSSLPEVAGDAAVLVDPGSPADLADAIGGLLSDPARRADLRDRGIDRATAFSWERTARTVRACLERLR